MSSQMRVFALCPTLTTGAGCSRSDVRAHAQGEHAERRVKADVAVHAGAHAGAG